MSESDQDATPVPKTSMKVFKEIPSVLFLLLIWYRFCQRIFEDFAGALYLSFDHVDAMGQHWMVWWAKTALGNPDLSIYQCPLLNPPVGTQIFTFDVAYYHILLSAMLAGSKGVVWSINFVFVTGVMLSLFGTYVLIRQFTNQRVLAALLATLPVAQRLFLQEWYVDIELANMGFITLALALWIRSLKHGEVFWLIIAGILAGLTCAGQMYYGIPLYGTYFLTIILAFFGLMPKKSTKRILIKRTVLVMGIGMMVALPFLYQSIKALTAQNIGPSTGLNIFSSYVPPGHSLPLIGVLPAIVLALTVVAVDRTNRQLWFWFGATALFISLGLGPYLNIGSLSIPLPMWFVYKFVPFFWRFTTPARFGVAGFLLFVCLLAYLFQVLQEKRKLGLLFRLPGWIVIFLFGALSLNVIQNGRFAANPHFYSLQTQRPAQIPEIYNQIARNPENYIIFDLVCENEATWSGYYQTAHKKPIAGYSLIPPNFMHLQKTGELSAVQLAMCESAKRGRPSPPPTPKWLLERNVRYAALHKSYLEDAGAGYLNGWESTFGEPEFASDRVRIYKVQPD